jgi:hypothetical protein
MMRSVFEKHLKNEFKSQKIATWLSGANKKLNREAKNRPRHTHTHTPSRTRSNGHYRARRGQGVRLTICGHPTTSHSADKIDMRDAYKQSEDLLVANRKRSLHCTTYSEETEQERKLLNQIHNLITSRDLVV